MTQHGFARHNEFDIVEQGEDYVIFGIDDTNFLDVYPYHFELLVHYSLKESTLCCHCTVKNKDDKTIYFGLGGHPAFACPMYDDESSNDYYIEFEKNETLERRMLNTANSLYNGKVEPLFDNEKRFFVRQAMFKDDAVVVTDFKSSWVSLKSLNHQKAVTLHMDNFNFLGIWGSKHVGGLIALEPWCGHADVEGFTGEFKEKEGIIALDQGNNFDCEFDIEITQ